ncbi:hypothetical protein KO507_04355 [Gilvimarinus agarilyticus]|uniref:hypothetical protein n=1 Tax=unclassified Gilvimarinus TaxID=2642066 RepID=UPI001C09A0B8|nr:MULTISPECIES: hypothetical protein [unclassified Gilvimarinus]MBU2884997.1 hypothetical protein [Gilvimarinus agarilyticus]MDO6569894.1 hypothetical protein [Gilvimarinus sp. 2_MG-2023]MDO6747103.1 hypothetical protein [Gilvimarinus sp. 1_MG-2023]
MTKKMIAGMLVATALVTGCQTQPNVQKMQDENEQLQSELDQARSKIVSLQNQELTLQTQINDLKRVMSVLDTEKTVRVQESSELRGQVRRFVQKEIDELKDFMVQSDLLDYIGGELVQRSQVDSQSLLLVDIENPMPANGTITGVSAHFVKPGTFTVQVMRPVQDQMLVIWQSEVLRATDAGVARVNFPVSVGVEQGDYIGYYFQEAGIVSFDEGTGNTRYIDDTVSLGESLKMRALKGERDKRAYSVGVYGLMN